MEANLNFAGIDVGAEVWLGQSLVIGLLILLCFLSFSYIAEPALIFLILGIIGFSVFLIVSLSIPYFISKGRANAVEKVLPSALQLMASNIRAGMSPFQALKFSARDEFGVLKDELDRATTKALGTGSFTDALMEASKRIDLLPLERSIKIFSKSIESGTHLASVLEDSARDITEKMYLRKELLSSTRTYTLLIILSIIFGMPLLLNVSINFTETMNEMKGSFDTTEIEGMDMGMLTGGGAFTADFLVGVSVVIIIGSTFISGLFIGVITEGSERYGLKYSFILTPVTLILFYILRFVVVYFLGV
ncbi:type II secretion system F family protein [Candidatus Altiarchaeota archaeon]